MHPSKISFFLASLSLYCVFTLGAFAQKNTQVASDSARTASTSIDGHLEDWSGIDFTTNKVSGVQYALRNNDSTLFIAIKTLPGESFGKVMNWGLSLGFNALGSKKVKQSITFPAGRPSSSATSQAARGAKADAKNLVSLFNALHVAGFNDFLDGKLSLQNDFGIQAALYLSGPQVLHCEYAIPLKLIGFNSTKSTSIACQIKLNGLILPKTTERSMNAGLTGSSMRPGMATSPLLEGSDFWVLYTPNTSTH